MFVTAARPGGAGATTDPLRRYWHRRHPLPRTRCRPALLARCSLPHLDDTLALVLWRGRGNLVPLLLLGSILPMIGSHELGVRTCQMIVLACVVVGGAFIAWYGRKTLLDAAEILGRPLAWWEWVLDPTFDGPRPFHSFMFVQLPWWALVYAWAALYMTRILVFGDPSTTS